MKAQFASETSESGEYQRQADTFREWISNDGSTPYPAAAGRYHLYISLACPWASRTNIFRKLKGLEDAIGMTVVDPIRDEKGWAFRDPHSTDSTSSRQAGSGPAAAPSPDATHSAGSGQAPRVPPSTDPVNGFRYLSEAYAATDPNYKERVTVPALWDKETKRIVNNCEDDICRMFNDAFNEFAQNKDADFFPKEIGAEHDKLCEFIHDNINNGVYRAGFATRQRPYEISCRKLFEALDEMEKRLTSSRYLFSKDGKLSASPTGGIVEADWRLFCTLVRFDVVYHGHFKCNLRRIIDYPNLQGYLMDLYQHPGIAETVNIDHIKRHYYMTHTEINLTRIVPIGPELDLTKPHGRERL